MTQASPSSFLQQNDRQSRDRDLFDGICEQYAFKDLHPASSTARRQRLLRTLAAAPVPQRPSILEAGCGAGFSASYLDGRFSRYVGVDYSEKLIQVAKERNAVAGAEFIASNIKDIDMPGQFDVVVMIGVLHHMDDMASALQQLLKTLKPGGWLLANEPQPGNPLISAARWARKRMDGGYSDEQDELRADQLRSLYQQGGLTKIGIIPQGLLSTPFAEVPMSPSSLSRPLSKACCAVDTAIERGLRSMLKPITWNLIASGQKA